MHDLREAVRRHQSPMVFFHGDGVDVPFESGQGWPESNPEVDWWVCRTSLERRMPPDALPTAFAVATLVTFYQAASSARRVDSLGLGGRLRCRPASCRSPGDNPNRLLLEVGFAPVDERQRREALEMALGAAALELDASVLFHGDGLTHLAGDAARGWAQITDFGLLDMYAGAPGRRVDAKIPVQAADAAQVADLRARAATILIL